MKRRLAAFAMSALLLCGCSEEFDSEYFGDVLDEALGYIETYDVTQETSAEAADETTAEVTTEAETTAAEAAAATTETEASASEEAVPQDADAYGDYEYTYSFRNDRYLREHFEKHGGEFSFRSEQECVEGANSVIYSADALHKTEAEDGDDIYYIEDTNEFVVVSKDGYIRTYFKPSRGIAYYYAQ